MTASNGPFDFPNTGWTLLEAARNPNDKDQKKRLNEFIAVYWRPVYYYIRRRGFSQDKADDLTQEFLLRFLEKDLLNKANRERGRFRGLLCKNLKWFLADQGKDRAPRQEGFEQGMISVESLLTAEDRSYEPASNETAEDIFEQQWARGVWNRAIDRLGQFYRTVDGRPEWFEVFTATHLAEDATRIPSQEAIGDRFGMSRDQVRYALERLERTCWTSRIESSTRYARRKRRE